VHHLFCKACGIESFARGTGKNSETHYMISVRCLDGADIGGRDIPEYDGKKL
jgi:hypothetical protein